jgi:hypothetical protein
MGKSAEKLFQRELNYQRVNRLLLPSSKCEGLERLKTLRLLIPEQDKKNGDQHNGNITLTSRSPDGGKFLHGAAN